MLKPLIELLFADLFWGFGFVATVWALKDLGTPAIIFYRFLIAFAVGMIFLIASKAQRKILVHEFRLSFLAGFLLSLTLGLQTWGLMHVKAGVSAFITTLYVVMVPLLLALITRYKVPRLHYFFVGLALIGTSLLVGLRMENWGIGESLTLGNAFTASLHIIYMDHIGRRTKSPFAFNVFQSLWAALLILPIYPLDSRWSLANVSALGWTGLLSLALGSTLLGFFLQLRAQQKVAASTASLLFLLESPFSFLFAWMLLGERYTPLQIFGAALILIACSTGTWYRSLGTFKK